MEIMPEKRTFCGASPYIRKSSIGNYYLDGLSDAFWKNFNAVFPIWSKEFNVVPQSIPVFKTKKELYDFCDIINEAYKIVSFIPDVTKIIRFKIVFLNVEGYIVSNGNSYWFVPKNIDNTDFWIQFYQKVPDWQKYAINFCKKLEVRFINQFDLTTFLAEVNTHYSSKIGDLLNGDFSSISIPEGNLKTKSDNDSIIKIKTHHIKIFN